MLGIPSPGGLSPGLVFDLFHIDVADEDLAAEHHRDPSRVRRDPNRTFIHSFRVAFLHMVFDAWNDFEGLDLTGSDFDGLSPLDFQIQQVTIFSAEDIEVKAVANL